MITNILFIGGAGFIGSNIIRSLTGLYKDSFKIYVIEPHFANVDSLCNLDVFLFRGTISDFDFVKSIIDNYDIDIVVHLVSTLVPGSSFEDWRKEYDSLILPSFLIMQFCAKNNIRFVYFSSGGTIYGNGKGQPFKESDPMAPISYYGWSKQMIENTILFLHRTQNLNYLIIRPSNPYGPGQKLDGKQGLIAVAIGRALENRCLDVWGDGTSVRDYIYIDDLCVAFCKLISLSIINQTLNIGSGVGYSIFQVTNLINSIIEEKLTVKFVPPRNADVSSMVLDTTNLKKLIEFHPISLQQGIKSFYLYCKNNTELVL